MAVLSKRILLLTPLAIYVLILTFTYFLPCRPRKNTTRQAIFDLTHGTHPGFVSYDFQSLAPSIVVTVPRSSNWYSLLHYHEKPKNSASLLVLSGPWSIGTTICHAGCETSESPFSYTSWGPYWYGDFRATSASLSYKAPVPFYRTMCSVMQDADVYFKLCETPLWLRTMYISTYLNPLLGSWLRERMIKTALWFQLQVVYETNDFWPYVWEIPFTAWYLLDPPQWAIDWRERSKYVISEGVVRYGSSVFLVA
jgi:hypothetical protein